MRWASCVSQAAVMTGWRVSRWVFSVDCCAMQHNAFICVVMRQKQQPALPLKADQTTCYGDTHMACLCHMSHLHSHTHCIRAQNNARGYWASNYNIPSSWPITPAPPKSRFSDQALPTVVLLSLLWILGGTQCTEIRPFIIKVVTQELIATSSRQHTHCRVCPRFIKCLCAHLASEWWMLL